MTDPRRAPRRALTEEDAPQQGAGGGEHLLSQLVAHLREHRTRLRQEWSERIKQAHLLTAMTPQEMAAETTSVYDNYVEVLETGTSRRCSTTRATCPNGSSREGSRPTK